jgi:hypothetical protein
MKEMKERIINLSPQGVFHVPFQDTGIWRVGVYNPDAGSVNEINRLEKHSCPELFICLQGRMGLLVKEDGKETIFELSPNQAIMVTEWHNGFIIDPKGYFIVVERTDFSTEYVTR